MWKKLYISTLILAGTLFNGCTETTVQLAKPNIQTNNHNSAVILIGVDGDKKRAVRHVVIGTKESKEDYKIYFHDKKISEGFIAFNIPAPSSKIILKEYSLSGHYGCSRGKAGYGLGSKIISKVLAGKTYYLGTINTDMNTVYDEMSPKLIKEAKQKYNYKAHGTDLPQSNAFRNHISI